MVSLDFVFTCIYKIKHVTCLLFVFSVLSEVVGLLSRNLFLGVFSDCVLCILLSPVDHRGFVVTCIQPIFFFLWINGVIGLLP